MLRPGHERRIAEPMQQSIHRIERAQLPKLGLQNPLHVFATQRADAILRQRTGIEPLLQLVRFLRREWRLAAAARLGF